MRLIDADKLKKAIDECYEYEFPTASGAFDEFAKFLVPNIIDEQPTAYDVDKVVEGLKASCCENRWCIDCSECYFEQAIYKAIDIVKRGGVDG